MSAETTERGQQRSHELTEQRLVTGRYTAVGAGSLDIRLGGIYAPERLAADSVRDRPRDGRAGASTSGRLWPGPSAGQRRGCGRICTRR
ncbi:hypothetical protein SMC26_16635 [Actinomadura fulvescens]|uniref:Uncharacterized protein n=1 Tax=Actinomadura fulvescens TaxID=46160 RepID=A0ABP6BUY9_9ACTN